MIKHFKTLLMLCALGGATATAQTLDRTMQSSASPTTVETQKSSIKLNPASRYNVMPGETTGWLEAANPSNNVLHKVQQRIPANENAADSVVIYGIYKRDLQDNLPSEMISHGMYSFHASKGFDFYDEWSGATIPVATAYVRVNDTFWSIELGKIHVYDANTGALIKDVELKINDEDVNPMQAAAYDPVNNVVYLVYWAPNYAKGMLHINAETFEATAGGTLGNYPFSVAVAPDGKIYYFDHPSELYSYDPTTLESTVVFDKLQADKNYQNATATQSCAFDWSTGYLYLANLTSDWKTHLTKIDVATGTAVDIADFPANERMMGLYIPYADKQAPGFASKISYADGKLYFTAPSKTYSSGEELTGTLTAYIKTDRGTAKEVSVAPGEDAVVDYALADGKHIVEIEMGNSAGKSPARRLNTFVGNDVPRAVGNLTLSIEDGVNAVLSWTAPTASVGGGYVDDAAVNYTVVRYPDETVVAAGLTETTFTEAIPDALAHYYYTVTAFNDKAAGEMATSNVVTAGSVWYPPYVETFDTQADFDTFKVVDANNDMNTWGWSVNGFAAMQGNGTANVDTGIYEGNGNDDYLITPSLSLKKDVDYRISFETFDQWMSIENMSILLGKKQDVVGDEVEIAKLELQPGLENRKEYSVIFNVPEDGLYNILFHGNNPGQSVNIYIDDITFKIYSSFNGPDCATDVKAVAGAMGALNNTLKLTAPTKTYKGDNLEAISYINVYRNGSKKPAHVFEAPEPGVALTWEDTEVAQGLVTYSIIAFNEAGQGKEVTVTNWVGLDEPADVPTFKAVMNEEFKPVVTFEMVTGVGKHGGYVNPEEVMYALYRYNEYNYDNHWEAVTEPTADFTLTDANVTPSYGAQQQYFDYKIVASNSAGKSEGAQFGIVLGEPYARPYAESFPWSYSQAGPWTMIAPSYPYAWKNVNGAGIAVKPYDGDEGMLQFTYYEDLSNEHVIMGPRVSLVDSKQTELSFFMYHGFEAEEGDLSLIVYTNYDDEGWKQVATVDYNNGASGWTRFALPLATDKNNVQIAFGAYAVDASASIYVDAIKVEEGLDKDVTVTGIQIDSKRIEAGEATKVRVEVANYGIKTAENYNVVLLRDDVEYMTAQGTALAQNTISAVEFDITTTKADAKKTYIYRAELKLEGDENAANNQSSTVRLYVHGSNLPEAENLAGELIDGNVALTWDAPATDEIPDTATDDFEAYESFIIEGFGDWKVYDGDGTPTVYFGGPQVANTYEPKAWQVWAPVEAGFSLDKFDVLTPHSGDKYLACWAASNGTTSTLPNDDWLISADVIGGTDVSFFYRMPNEGSDPQIFEMLYSATDQEIENFIVFDRDSIVATTDWVKFEYTLPEDAKYFALRSCSKGAYTVAFLDDITYTPLYGSTTKVTLAGYNVYRDNQLIAEGVTETSFVDTKPGTDKHVYHVTAKWAEGESDYSNPYEFSYLTGISLIEDNSNVEVVGLENAIAVKNAEGKTVNIFTLAGMSVFREVAEGNLTVNVAPGIYLVNVDNAVFKVYVK